MLSEVFPGMVLIDFFWPAYLLDFGGIYDSAESRGGLVWMILTQLPAVQHRWTKCWELLRQ